MTTTGNILASLQFETTPNYEANLETLVSLCQPLLKNTLVLAPEVSVTGFDYEHFLDAANFSKTIDTALLKASENKTIVTTMIEKLDGNFYNIAKVYHEGKIIHTQKKYKLFTLGQEQKYFTAGEKKDIIHFNVGELKVAILICFELRFTELWQQIKGADVILVPSRWGKLRSEHFTTLSKALAISNQCYVIATDASNPDTTSKSAIITPFGESFSNQSSLVQTLDLQMTELKKMRKYIDIGL